MAEPDKAGSGGEPVPPAVASKRSVEIAVSVLLLAFAAVLLPSSVLIFSWSLRRTKITGTLTHR